MWVLPFLYYYHAYPLTTYYQEWGAAMLGIAASMFVLSRQYWRQAEVPRIILLPLLLVVLIFIQYAAGKITYFDQALLFTLYMLWIALLMLLGHGLRERLGWPLLATALAIFLLAGAELNALVGILQHYRWHTFLDGVVTHKNGVAVYGNLAQPNHYASYITMGLVSLGLLGRQLRLWQAVSLAAPLLFVLVLSGSRSAWLYLPGMVALAFLWQRRDASCRYLLNYALLLLCGFVLMHWIVQLPWLSPASGNITSMQRLLGESGTGSIRLYLWHEAWLMFSQFPLLGVGFAQFGWQHFQLAPSLHDTNLVGLYNNAHNLLLQLAAEMGLAGVLVLCGTLGVWLWQGMRAQQSVYHWWGYGIVLVLGIHSMVEYPLWYAYFLSIAAVLLGGLDRSSYRLALPALGRLYVAVIVLAGMVMLLQWQQGYRRLERALAVRPLSTEDTSAPQRMREGLASLYGTVFVQPYAELFLNNWIGLNTEHLEESIAMNERSGKFIPVKNVVYQRALLLALSNQPDEACLQIERAIWAYPGDFKKYRQEIAMLAQKDPAHFAALLEFATQKNEEYINAVPAK